MTRALLLGQAPGEPLGYEYVAEPPYEAVVVGSVSLGQLLGIPDQRVLEALARGKPVLLYTPGLPDSPRNRGLSASLASARRQLKAWGVVFTDGGRRHLVTAEEAGILRSQGRRPGPGAVLTPLAREILEGSSS